MINRTNDIYGSKDNPIKFNDIETRNKLLGVDGVIATHDGKYHDDDLMACAIFNIYYEDKLKVVRTRNIEPLSKYTDDIIKNDPNLVHKLNCDAHSMTRKCGDKDVYMRNKKRNYMKLVKEAAYDKHNHQAVPIVMDNGSVKYFELDCPVDVGYGELDHHDDMARRRYFNEHRSEKPDEEYWRKPQQCRLGVKYAATGLTWRKVGRDVIKKCLAEHKKFAMYSHDDSVVEEIFNIVDEELMSAIDYYDNSNNREYDFSRSYKGVMEATRDVVEFDYEMEDSYEDGKRTPFEVGAKYLGDNLIKKTVRRAALEAMETRRNATKFNDAVDNCTNESRTVVFDNDFRFGSLLKENPKAKFVNFVIMKENDGDRYLVKFCNKNEYSISGKPLLEHWQKGYGGIEHVNEHKKVVSVDTLENAQSLVDEFYEHYAKSLDRTENNIEAMRGIENTIDLGIDKQKEVMLGTLYNAIQKMTNALKVLKASLQLSIKEGRYEELLSEIEHHEDKIHELKCQHNDLSEECGKRVIFNEVLELENDDELEM